MPTHDYTKPPRTMPHTFARQGETIKRLQAELDAANDRIVELTKALDTMNERQRQEWARAENAEAQRDSLREELMSCLSNDIFVCDANGWNHDDQKRRLAELESMTPDAVTKRLLENAPESVKGGEKSQS